MPVFRPGGGGTKDKDIRRVFAGDTAMTVVGVDVTVSLVKVDDVLQIASGAFVLIQDLILDDEWTHVRIAGTGDTSRACITFHAARR